MKNKKGVYRGLLIGVPIAVVLISAWLAFCGYQWSWGPFVKLHDLKTSQLPGNAEQYNVDQITPAADSPLAGKHIVFLGSSVTYGASSQGTSFADFIAARNGCTITKEAVSGTTLVDNGPGSYIPRMEGLDAAMQVDLFVCQLSTNDATQGKPLGSAKGISDPENFDTSTVAGAIEYIIAYASQTWKCPVVFYTNPQYDSQEYAAMVELLNRIREQWDVTVIDLWSDADFNAITPEQRSLYMADEIHPTKAGYLEWWTPYMERVLFEAVAE